MSSGAEHYTEAERLLDRSVEDAFSHDQAWYLNVIQRAQVHATLAQTAALAEGLGLVADLPYDGPDGSLRFSSVPSAWKEALQHGA